MEIKPNLLRPRWRKVLSDLWSDKTRTTLVAASIATGVFAVGTIITAFIVLDSDIPASFASANPVNIEIRTAPFQEDLVRVVEKVPGVEEVEGRRIISVRSRRDGEYWQSLTLIAMKDFGTSTINQLDVIEGRMISGEGEVVLSRDFNHDTGYQVGDEIEVEFPDGSTEILVVVGIVTDQTGAKPSSENDINAFVSLNTLRGADQESDFSHLFITVEGDGNDEEFIEQVADEVEDRIERRQEVYSTKVQLSNEHPMMDTVRAVIGLLGALGGLITILSSSLIINTLNALLAQQLRQIGVMKLVGGRSTQIMGMYLTLIAAYGVVALIVAVPGGAFAGYSLARFVASLTSAVLQGFRFIPVAIVVQVIIAFVIPLGAGFVPVNRGARANVHRAISNYRPDSQSSGLGLVKRGARWSRRISRPVLLSIRNTFRKKGRLLLTIFTLTVGGAVFIGVFNVRASTESFMEQLMQHFQGDVTVNFSQPYPVAQIEHTLLPLPGVEGVEGWSTAGGEIWDQNDDLVSYLSIIGPPEGTRLIDPEIEAGRWLQPGDGKVIVVSDSIYKFYPDLVPGDTVTIKLPGVREEEWTVVGVFPFVDALGDPIAYTHFQTLSDVISLANQTASYRIVTEDHSAASQRDLTEQVDYYLAQRDYIVQSVNAGYQTQESATTVLNIVISFLLLMALLAAFVGSIGLTGTMSMNILERTREIGVMRAIGAVDFMVMQSVVIEGMVIGLITWVLAICLSFPVSKLLLAIIGEAMTGSAISMIFTSLGLFLWLGVVVALSLVASIAPARKAARLTINEVLAYE